MYNIETENSKTVPRALSLLWPGTHQPDTHCFVIDQTLRKDLELDKLFRYWAVTDREFMELENQLCHISCDPDIINYRQKVMEDMLRFPDLVNCLENILPQLEMLKSNQSADHNKQLEMYKLIDRLGELESYIFCIQELQKAFEKIREEFTSPAWQRLRQAVDEISCDPAFISMVTELPDLLAGARAVRSVSIGVNLDRNLHPCEATLLAINQERYTGKSANMFNRILGNNNQKLEGIARLHAVPRKILHTPAGTTVLDPEIHGYGVNPLMVPLFSDINDVIKKTAAPLSKALRQFISVNTVLLGNLKREIAFYLGAYRLITTIRETGLPFCRPVIRPAAERRCFIKNSYNINLVIALLNRKQESVADAVVKNDIRMDEDGRVIILTGLNRGGKTTYLQAIGLCQILAQLGLPVPGEEAEISPVDGIYTHFPAEEKIDRGTGRLGDESRRISTIFSMLTPESLLLLNESFSSTSAGESSYIAAEIVQVLCTLRTRTVFTTHLYELAYSVDRINGKGRQGNKVVNMIADVSEETSDSGQRQRTFKIIRGQPTGNSYAQEIAERFGVSHKQLTAQLQDRGLLKTI